jgi:hypothetical protein
MTQGKFRQRGASTFVFDRDAIGRVIYMAHPVNGDVEGNLKRAKIWLKHLTEGNPWVAFNTQWIVECELWDDSDAEERRKGLKRCLAHVERCDEVWLVGLSPSNGMMLEAGHAIECGIKVVDLTGRALPELTDAEAIDHAFPAAAEAPDE